VAFLECLAAAYSVTAAAAAAGVNRRRFYELAGSDEAFRAEMSEAYDKGTDALRDEARRRAVDGWDEPVFQKGELVGQIRRFDSRLLELELKRRDPSYRENHRVEVSGAAGGEPVRLSVDGWEPTSLVGVLAFAVETGAPGLVDRLAELGFVLGRVEESRERPALPPAEPE
jgi:hypothetical protein